MEVRAILLTTIESSNMLLTNSFVDNKDFVFKFYPQLESSFHGDDEFHLVISNFG